MLVAGTVNFTDSHPLPLEAEVYFPPRRDYILKLPVFNLAAVEKDTRSKNQ